VWQSAVTLSALGDLMVTGEWEEVAASGGLSSGLSDLAALTAAHDLVFANLEVTVAGSEGSIPKQPRLVGRIDTIVEALQILGVDLANLGNNHTFDCYRSGFEAVRQALEKHGIGHLGAGLDPDQAAAPLTLERGGIRFGWLSYTALDTEPSHVAGGVASYGVNPLVAHRALAEVEDLKARVDHVIVSLHWGVEHCQIPSPAQVEIARSLVDRGASLVIGHHVHVVQGVEARGSGAIIYNLGNAMATDLFIDGRRAIRQTPRSTSSFVMRAAFTPEKLAAVELVPFRIVSGSAILGDRTARRLLERANRRLAAGISPGKWMAVRLYEDLVVRTLKKLHPHVIRSVRLRHFARFGQNLRNALRRPGPAPRETDEPNSGKSRENAEAGP
jgi:poly-gamma-glutamate synthesis protein (capsule biosynthesis protein)